MDPPRQIDQAVALLWLAFALSLGELLILEFFDAQALGLWAVYVIAFGIWAAIIVAISHRMNWARVFVAVFVTLAVAAFTFLPDMRSGVRWWQQITLAITYGLDAVALYLLFSGAGAKWFRASGNERAF